jgi:hypothetical protein
MHIEGEVPAGTTPTSRDTQRSCSLLPLHGRACRPTPPPTMPHREVIAKAYDLIAGLLILGRCRNLKMASRMLRRCGRSPLPPVALLLRFQQPQPSRIAARSMTITPSAVGAGARDREQASASARSKARFPATRSTSSPTGMAIVSTGAITAPLEAPVGENLSLMTGLSMPTGPPGEN